jgi:hypothetical protein
MKSFPRSERDSVSRSRVEMSRCELDLKCFVSDKPLRVADPRSDLAFQRVQRSLHLLLLRLPIFQTFFVFVQN